MAYEPGDTVAVAVVRAGQHPARGGTLCLAGDCGNCVAEIDGIAYVRTCLTPARDGLAVQRHPVDGPPRWRDEPREVEVAVSHDQTDVAVIGGGEAGQTAAAEVERGGRRVLVLDGGSGDEVVAVYAGPTVIVRRDGSMVHLRADEVVVATGTAEIQPVGPGSRLAGLLTARAACRGCMRRAWTLVERSPSVQRQKACPAHRCPAPCPESRATSVSPQPSPAMARESTARSATR